MHSRLWHSPADADVAVAGLVLLDDHTQQLAQLCGRLQLQRVMRAAGEAWFGDRNDAAVSPGADVIDDNGESAVFCRKQTLQHQHS